MNLADCITFRDAINQIIKETGMRRYKICEIFKLKNINWYRLIKGEKLVYKSHSYYAMINYGIPERLIYEAKKCVKPTQPKRDRRKYINDWVDEDTTWIDVWRKNIRIERGI